MLAMKAKNPRLLFGANVEKSGMTVSKILSCKGKLFRIACNGKAIFAITLSDELIKDGELVEDAVKALAKTADESEYLGKTGKRKITKGKFAGQTVTTVAHAEPIVLDGKELIFATECVKIGRNKPFIKFYKYVPEELDVEETAEVEAIAIDDED